MAATKIASHDQQLDIKKINKMLPVSNIRDIHSQSQNLITARTLNCLVLLEICSPTRLIMQGTRNRVADGAPM